MKRIVVYTYEASIAQLGERGTEVAKVIGSIPIGGIFCF